MIKNDYVTRAKKFMESFIDYMWDKKDIYDVKKAVHKFNIDNHRKVIFRNGAVRCCLITSDYVVKWDYNVKNRLRFGGCKKEYDTYLRAKQDGYGYLFAAVNKIKVKNQTFYVMPRVKSIGFDAHKHELEGYLTDEEIDYLYDELLLWDLHDDNYGLINSKPILVDYACRG